MVFEVRAAEPGEESAVVPLYEWLFAPPGSRPCRVGRAPGGRRAARGDRLARRLRAGRRERLRGADRLLHRLPGHALGPLRLPGLGRGPRGGPRAAARGASAAALLGAARDWARERGATHLELDSAEARADAHRFYEREGAAYRAISLRLGALTPMARIVLFGATGYTGRLTAEALVARGARPLLAARSAAKLDDLARRSGRRARDKRSRTSAIRSRFGRWWSPAT